MAHPRSRRPILARYPQLPRPGWLQLALLRLEKPVNNHFGIAMGVICAVVIGGALVLDRSTSKSVTAQHASVVPVKSETHVADATTTETSSTPAAPTAAVAPIEPKPLPAAPAKPVEHPKKVATAAAVKSAPVVPAQRTTRPAPAPVQTATVPAPIESAAAPAAPIASTPAQTATTPAPLDSTPAPTAASPDATTPSVATVEPPKVDASGQEAAKTDQ
jgi:hypothetical protein